MTAWSASVRRGKRRPYLLRNRWWLAASSGETPITGTPAAWKPARLSLNWQASLVHTVSSPLTVWLPVVLCSSSEEVVGDLACDLLGVVAQLRRQVLVEPEGGQPMDQGPGGDTGPHVAAVVGAVVGLGGRRVQQRPGCVAGPDELGVVGVVQLGAEHHLKVGPVGDGEADIGDPDLQEAPAGLVGLAEGGGQPPEPVGGDRGQQAGLVAEVVGRGGMGDPGPAGQVPQADRGRPDLGDRLDGGLQQGPWEVAVMVGPSIVARPGGCGHCSIISGILPLTRLDPRAYLDVDKIDSSGRSAVNTPAVATEPAA